MKKSAGRTRLTAPMILGRLRLWAKREGLALRFGLLPRSTFDPVTIAVTSADGEAPPLDILQRAAATIRVFFPGPTPVTAQATSRALAMSPESTGEQLCLAATLFRREVRANGATLLLAMHDPARFGHLIGSAKTR